MRANGMNEGRAAPNGISAQCYEHGGDEHRVCARLTALPVHLSRRAPIVQAHERAGQARLWLMDIWQITAKIKVAAPLRQAYVGLLKISTIWVVHGDRQFQRTR
jgi:hypothetical protein